MKVCILGSGLTSLTLAKALVKENIYVDILETKKTIKPDKTRTIGISKSNVEFFNNNIVNINSIIWNIKKIEIFSDNLKKEKLLKFENSKKELFSIIKNYKLFNLLEKSLSKNKYFKKKIFKNNLAFLKKYSIIINTDNLNLITRKYFSKKIIKKYNSFAYTTIIDHHKIENNNIATQIFTKIGPIAFLPISNVQTSIVYSVHNSRYKKDENIYNLIQIYNFKYKIKKIRTIKSFELHSLNLRSYFHKNILAFGDLLHRIHPLAGQGFNMTIRDIKLLTDLIKFRNNLGLPLDSSIILEFQNKIKHKNYIFSNTVDFVHEFFNLERKTNKVYLSKSVQFLGKNHLINKFLRKIADQGITF